MRKPANDGRALAGHNSEDGGKGTLLGNIAATKDLKITSSLLYVCTEQCKVMYSLQFGGVGVNTTDQRHSPESVAAP